MARCQEMSPLPAGYIPQCKVSSASGSRSLVSLCVKCCIMVDSVLRCRPEYFSLRGNKTLRNKVNFKMFSEIEKFAKSWKKSFLKIFPFLLAVF